MWVRVEKKVHVVVMDSKSGGYWFFLLSVFRLVPALAVVAGRSGWLSERPCPSPSDQLYPATSQSLSLALLEGFVRGKKIEKRRVGGRWVDGE